ncbi:uncharacterized protein PFLUO_LOCUS7509 [Penicillium psychrofluorescens]|uniref:uncharacterized protein n=1 Tax=Penicillium psychrofluorescens TaxID=3158075 RepID=UPI003CCDF3C9
MKTFASLTLLAAGAAAQAIEGLSFGHERTLSPDRYSIPGWKISGEGHDPTLMSNKLILTPPYPGNTRGAVWAQSPATLPEWSAEFQFRASGPERAGGILQLWYTKDGQVKVGTSSIYTVGQWDGFALVIDTHSGRGGSIRGFLNDGTTDYKSHRSVDSLAFGHCDYAYRNLGRPSVVKLKHTNSIFEVTVDDRVCFSTNQVALPTGNTFGITAATPETPDSFEIFKFLLQSAAGQGIPAQQMNSQQQQQSQPILNQNTGNPAAQQAQAADPGTAAGFADLSGRLQLTNKAVQNILQDLRTQSQKSDSRHAEVQQKLATKGELAAMDARLERIETALQYLQRDMPGKDIRESFNQLEKTLRSSHLSLSENLQGHVFNVITASTPRMGFFIFLVLAFQLLLAVSYVIYKRRRASMPKKFL